MRRSSSFFYCPKRNSRFSVTGLVILSMILSQLSFIPSWLPRAEAAVVVIDDTTSTSANEHLNAGSRTVFISDQTGYKFYVDANGTCVYRKTTDGGGSWGSTVTVDSQTDCDAISVWYDRWTPGDYGDYIHIATMESASTPDHLYYNRLDTTSDTRLMGTTPVNISTSSGQVATLVAGTNNIAITKSTGGGVFVTTADASDSFIVSCASSCNTESNWGEVGTSPLDLANDFSLLMPLLTGGVLLINRDVSLDDIRSSVWNGTSWSSWVTLDSSAIESAAYDVGMSATINHEDGTIYLAYTADNNSYTALDHDVRTAKFNSGSWTNTIDVFTNDPVRGLNEVAIALDINTATVYVAYTMRTVATSTNTANVYFATSTSAMSGWATEQGPVNTVSGNLYGLDLNIMSDERIFASWYDPAPDDIYGETIANLTPATKVSKLGTQNANVTASSSNTYLGGMYMVKESQTTRSVTDITITESGTIDASTNLSNVKLQYDLDTTSPYNCVSESYSGSESQFGSTDTNGFSGSNGVSSFTGSVSISPTQAMCVYVIVDVTGSANDGDTIAFSIASPPSDVLVSGGGVVTPSAPVSFSSNTLVINDKLTQSHYHWRNDNGNETGATSATLGTADTPLASLQQNVPKRLRFSVSNEGSTSSTPTKFRLEYALAAPSCDTASGWNGVQSGQAWQMYDSTHVTNSDSTTNISEASGGTPDENTTFLSSNNGLLDTSNETSALTLSSSNFVDLEFSIVASSSASEGSTYCFRLTDAGVPLAAYSQYPSVTVSADVTLSTIGAQTDTVLIPNTNQYVGGTFLLKENSNSRTINNVTITETGTVDAQNSLKNIRLFYDLDTTSPYNCVSESYGGGESQFGATDANGFSGSNGSSTFSGSLAISTTSTACFYVVLDVDISANNNDTLDIELSNGGSDIGLSSGAVSPTTPILLASSTTLIGANLDQIGFHFRLDNGSETSASSATAGSANTTLTDFQINDPIRLRLAVDNIGLATSSSQALVLEFGPKITTCSAVGVWTNVDSANDDWDLFNSVNLTDGADTTNITESQGGIPDPGGSNFIVNNNGVNTQSATSSSLVFAPNDFAELEYSLVSTNLTLYDTTYCFRVVNGSNPLSSYTKYAEVTTAPKRDFKVQRGVSTVTGTGLTLTAGVDYTAPAATSSAFVRITNTNHTGAGRTTAGGGSQNADDTTAYISASNLTTSFTIARPSAAINNTQVAWEIIEFVGEASTDNEMIVRDTGTVLLNTTDTSVSGLATSVTTDSDVVVYITGIENRSVSRNAFYAGQVSSSWDSGNNRPVFNRDASGVVVAVSYAVVEYTGINWQVQRVEHNYTAAGVTETESITPVNSLSRTFIHTQKRTTALGNVNNYGHEVWLSSIGAVSFQLDSAATTPSGHTSVVWIVENLQTSAGAMKVQRTNGNTSGGVEPVTIAVTIFTPIADTNNSSIFVNGRAVGANTTFPSVFAAAYITSTTSYDLWRSEASNVLTYRTEIVEWPVTGLAVRQNYYRIYTDNDALKPTDPWPVGVANLGENTSITAGDQPPGDGDHLRLRMSLKVSNATLPAGLYDFKLQYGLRVSTCSAVGTWTNVGNATSSTIWRTFDAPGVVSGTNLSVNPPSGGDLLLTVSDVAGLYTDSGFSLANPFAVPAGSDVEYDWHLQHNGATEKSTYCFRMIRSNGETLDGYLDYPRIRTAGFTPAVLNWRWYDDVETETPVIPLADEETAPIEIANQNPIALRVLLTELKNVPGLDVKFNLQYDETPLFTNPRDVVATSSCTASSTWCYSEAAGLDNNLINASVLTGTDACSGGVGLGCGTHNTTGIPTNGDTHPGSANREYAFYLKSMASRVGAVYYFRVFDPIDNEPVLVSASSSYPTLVAESAKLIFSISGLSAGTTTAGVILDATSSPAIINFGSIPLNTNYNAGHRILLDTNATEGYRVLMYARQPLLNSYGTAINSITSNNAVPASWNLACSASSTGCFGYHSTDATLYGGSTRFSPLDSFAGLETSPKEIMYNSLPAADTHDILYRIRVNELQPAGTYETEIVYIAIPSY